MKIPRECIDSDGNCRISKRWMKWYRCWIVFELEPNRISYFRLKNHKKISKTQHSHWKLSSLSLTSVSYTFFHFILLRLYYVYYLWHVVSIVRSHNSNLRERKKRKLHESWATLAKRWNSNAKQFFDQIHTFEQCK